VQAFRKGDFEKKNSRQDAKAPSEDNEKTQSGKNSSLRLGAFA
jgi:hypothetical protein